MKELKQHRPDEQHIKAEVPAKRQEVYMGALRPKPGQKVWQCDLKTGEVKEAEFDNTTVNALAPHKKKVRVKPGHIYAVAINKANAEKKFVKLLSRVFASMQQ